MAGLLGITLLICFVLSVPIAISLGITSMVIMMENGVPLTALAQKMFTSIDSFPLMAIPFFILAGSLMEHGGISRRLIDLVNSFIGSFTGGLAMVMIIASMFFFGHFRIGSRHRGRHRIHHDPRHGRQEI